MVNSDWLRSVVRHETKTPVWLFVNCLVLSRLYRHHSTVYSLQSTGPPGLPCSLWLQIKLSLASLASQPSSRTTDKTQKLETSGCLAREGCEYMKDGMYQPKAQHQALLHWHWLRHQAWRVADVSEWWIIKTGATCPTIMMLIVWYCNIVILLDCSSVMCGGGVQPVEGVVASQTEACSNSIICITQVYSLQSWTACHLPWQPLSRPHCTRLSGHPNMTDAVEK